MDAHTFASFKGEADCYGRLDPSASTSSTSSSSSSSPSASFGNEENGKGGKGGGDGSKGNEEAEEVEEAEEGKEKSSREAGGTCYKMKWVRKGIARYISITCVHPRVYFRFTTTTYQRNTL